MPKKVVKLDFKGLEVIARKLGKPVTFTTGLFDAENATKGFLLEYGREGQVSRPWFSQAVSVGSETLDQIMGSISEYVSDAMEGKDSSEETTNNITSAMQDHLLDQKFSVASLTNKTKANKRYKGSVTPGHVGLDGYDMVAALRTKIKGGG